jgi:putative phage-type endonuclease
MMRNFTVIDEQQRSPAWFAARAGRLTGSRAADIMKSGRKPGLESVARRDYRLQLVAERITGTAAPELFQTIDMQRGIALEPFAFARYEAVTGLLVRRTGFLSHNEYMAGCSLDGDTNNFAGIVELKCPKLSTHLSYLDQPQTLPHEYQAQVQHNLWITGAAYCDLISFTDQLPKSKQLLRMRIERYDAEIPDYEEAALKFLSEVEAQFTNIMKEETHATV